MHLRIKSSFKAPKNVKNPCTCAPNTIKQQQKPHKPTHLCTKIIKNRPRKTKNPRACAQKQHTRATQKHAKTQKTHTPVHKNKQKAAAENKNPCTCAPNCVSNTFRGSNKPTHLCTKVAQNQTRGPHKNVQNLKKPTHLCIKISPKMPTRSRKIFSPKAQR